jgi:ribosomal protein S18 acetylase RimI-like enzyme
MHSDAVLHHDNRSFLDKTLLTLARLVTLALPRMKHESVTDVMQNRDFASMIVTSKVGNMVGGCVFRQHVGVIEVWCVAVCREQRGCGIGSTMVEHLKGTEHFTS